MKDLNIHIFGIKGITEMTNNVKRLLNNVGYMFLGNFSSKVLTFFLLPLYTVSLTVDEYAISDLITTAVNLIMPVFTLGISDAVLRFTLDKDGDQDKMIKYSYKLSILGFFIMLIFSPIMIKLLGIWEYYVWFILYYAVYMLYNLLSSVCKGLDKVKIYSLCSVLHSVLVIIFNALFIFVLKKGIVGYLLANSLSFLIVNFVYFFSMNHIQLLIKKHKLNRNKKREMLQYSLPLIPNALSWWIVQSSDKFLLLWISGSGVTGLYSVAVKVPTILSTISTIFISAWQLSSVDNFGSDESVDFFSKMYEIYSLGILIFTVGLIVLSKLFSAFIFKGDFFQAWHYVPLLACGTMFNGIAGYLGSIFTAAKNTKILFVSTLAAAILNVILNVFLIDWFNAYGAIAATIISMFIVFLIRMIHSRKIVKLKINYWNNYICYMIVCILALCVSFESAVVIPVLIVTIVVLMYGYCNVLFYFLTVFQNKKNFY